jgi:hypothetical protein
MEEIIATLRDIFCLRPIGRCRRRKVPVAARLGSVVEYEELLKQREEPKVLGLRQNPPAGVKAALAGPAWAQPGPMVGVIAADDAIAQTLTATPADAARDRALMLARSTGNGIAGRCSPPRRPRTSSPP